jgi:hypothetical protein
MCHAKALVAEVRLSIQVFWLITVSLGEVLHLWTLKDEGTVLHLKCPEPYTQHHGVTSQKTQFLGSIAVSTSRFSRLDLPDI